MSMDGFDVFLLIVGIITVNVGVLLTAYWICCVPHPNWKTNMRNVLYAAVAALAIGLGLGAAYELGRIRGMDDSKVAIDKLTKMNDELQAEMWKHIQEHMNDEAAQLPGN